MRMTVLLTLMLSSIAGAANDFSWDTHCVALWRFENGALTTDSKSTNTLTNSGVVADTVNFAEGAASGDWELDESDYQTIADASLSAGFPLKNGDSNKQISVCFWVKPESIPASYGSATIFSKGGWTGVGVKSSFHIIIDRIDGSTAKFAQYIGYSTGSLVEMHKETNVTPAAGTWYHVGVTYQDSDKSWKIRVWNGAAASETTGTGTNAIYISDGDLAVGERGTGGIYYDGLIDEMVVFNDVLTSPEIDAIRGGTYAAPTTKLPVHLYNMNQRRR